MNSLDQSGSHNFIFDIDIPTCSLRNLQLKYFESAPCDKVYRKAPLLTERQRVYQRLLELPSEVVQQGSCIILIMRQKVDFNYKQVLDRSPCHFQYNIDERMLRTA